MTKTATVTTCSFEELAYMAGLLGADTLVGIPDPFQGLLAAEIEELLTHARTTLGQRGLLAVDPDGSIRLDEQTARLVEACAFANASLLVSAGEDGPWCQFHAGNGALVEVGVDLRNKQADLALLTDRTHLEERIAALLPLAARPAAPGGAATLKEVDLGNVRKAARKLGEAAATRLLQGAGVSEETAPALARALVKPALSGALIHLTHQTSDLRSEGNGFLAGEQGLWRLTAFVRSGERWVELAPCSGLEAADEVHGLIGRILA